MLSHHGKQDDSEQSEVMQRFIDQVNGKADRRWSMGRIGADDDGDLVIAMATDKAHGVIVLRFGLPVEWIGLGVAEAERLRDELTERLRELRAPV